MTIVDLLRVERYGAVAPARPAPAPARSLLAGHQIMTDGESGLGAAE